jgi:FkbM family methyltransferase
VGSAISFSGGSVTRLNDPGSLNKIAKKITPQIGTAVHSMGICDGIELFVSYLNLLVGKGSGTGWDKTETIATANVLRQVCPSGQPIVIDCGANIGNWTRELRSHMGSDSGRWIAIEPTHENVKRLESLANVEIIEAAAGERVEKLQLYNYDSGSGWTSLHPRNDSFAQGHQFSVHTVSVITIDSLIADRGLDHVDFMKMDIEGHELFALRGAMESLSARRIKALSFEFGSGNVNSRTFFRDFWDLLTPLGFELRRVCPGGTTVPIKSYYEDLEVFRGVTNYIAALGA